MNADSSDESSADKNELLVESEIDVSDEEKAEDHHNHHDYHHQRRWPLAIFYSIIDVCSVNAFTLSTSHDGRISEIYSEGHDYTTFGEAV